MLDKKVIAEQKKVINGKVHCLEGLNSKCIYRLFIAEKILLPRELLTNWCQELMISNEVIRSTASCELETFDLVGKFILAH